MATLRGDCPAALILLAGYGRPARSGVNAFWTRTARTLADRGFVVLRVDYSREGETLPIGEGGSGQVWKRDLDHQLLRQVARWFRERLDGLDLLLAGACAGARAAVEIVGCDSASFAGTFLIAPHLRALLEPGKEAGPQADDRDSVDLLLVDCFRTILARQPSWILIGEHDMADIPSLKRLIGDTTHDLEVERVPDVALHLLDQPAIQEEARRRLIARLDDCLTRDLRIP